MTANEKLGPKPTHAKRIADFCCMIKNCGLFDLGFNGPAYTWTNKRFSSNPTYEHLDRCLGNAEWCTTFPTTMVYHLPMIKSDHAPILAVLNSCRRNISKPFKFENWWLLEDDYESIANQSWQKSCNRPFHLKTIFLAKDLTRWRKSKPKNSDQLKAIEDQILQFQIRPPHSKIPVSKSSSSSSMKCYLPKKKLTTDRGTKRTGLLRVTGIPVSSTNPSSREPKKIPLPIFRTLMAHSPPPRINWLKLLMSISKVFLDHKLMVMQESGFNNGVRI
jgi:hypothetical protein